MDDQAVQEKREKVVRTFLVTGGLFVAEHVDQGVFSDRVSGQFENFDECRETESQSPLESPEDLVVGQTGIGGLVVGNSGIVRMKDQGESVRSCPGVPRVLM
jgi:hypothetical protein